jgi:hypothetical protein
LIRPYEQLLKIFFENSFVIELDEEVEYPQHSQEASDLGESREHGLRWMSQRPLDDAFLIEDKTYLCLTCPPSHF